MPYVSLHSTDNLCVATSNLAKGTPLAVDTRHATLANDIGIGHKIAIEPIARGAAVRKFGEVIGFATADIAPGELIHSHNLANGESISQYERGTVQPPVPALPPELRDRTFKGYRRADGRVGTRNYIGIISTVNCSATVARYIAERFDKSVLRDFPNIDGVVAFRHGGGCGMQFGGLQHEYLNRTLAGMARHPNIGGYLLVGLGCEQGAMGYLLAEHNLVQIDGLIQARGASEEAVRLRSSCRCKTSAARRRRSKKACAASRELLPRVNDVEARQRSPRAKSCSAPTAAAATATAASRPTRRSASRATCSSPPAARRSSPKRRRSTAPSTCSRAARKRAAVADKLLERIEWWEWYTGMFGVEIDNNPSVGNKEGGLTTIAEKSLGAVAKAGSTALTDVYRIRRADHRARASSSWTRPASTRRASPASSPAVPTWSSSPPAAAVASAASRRRRSRSPPTRRCTSG